MILEKFGEFHTVLISPITLYQAPFYNQYFFFNHRRLFTDYNCPQGWTFNITGQKPLLFSPNSTVSDGRKGEYSRFNIFIAFFWTLISGTQYNAWSKKTNTCMKSSQIMRWRQRLFMFITYYIFIYYTYRDWMCNYLNNHNYIYVQFEWSTLSQTLCGWGCDSQSHIRI